MSTNSIIAKQNKDGSIKAVYCHWDGYLSHNGAILLANYTTEEDVDNLLANGNLSVLAEKCTKPEGHSYENPVDGYCIYYGRDRGETNQNPKDFVNLSEWNMSNWGQEYEYLFKDGEWFWRPYDCKTFSKLTPEDCIDKD